MKTKIFISILTSLIPFFASAQDVIPAQASSESKITRKVIVVNGRLTEIIETNGVQDTVRLNADSKNLGDDGEADVWEWIHHCNDSKYTSYPIKEYYKTHSAHPGYKVYSAGSYDSGMYVVKQDSLLWVDEYIMSSLINNISPKLVLLRKAYSDNKYNVKKESLGTQAEIKYKLQLITFKQYMTIKKTNADVLKGIDYVTQLERDYEYFDERWIEATRQSAKSFIIQDKSGLSRFLVTYNFSKHKLTAKYTLLKQ